MTDYSHLLHRPSPVTLLDEVIFKECRRCNAGFTTRSRMKKRCDACQEIVDSAKVAKAHAKARARRAADPKKIGRPRKESSL